MPPETTPMMQQYLKIKEENKDAILFFRLGDFYEMFNEDAVLASQELDLTLTSRDRSRPEEERTPMCGVPYHSCEGYIARLIAKGYKVAICEQTEDPAAAKGLVKRDIIRVVTPGTVDSSMLEGSQANYICGIYLDEESAGVCFCDVTTGRTHATAFSGAERLEHVVNELGRFSPAEAVLSPGAAAEGALRDREPDAGKGDPQHQNGAYGASGRDRRFPGPVLSGTSVCHHRGLPGPGGHDPGTGSVLPGHERDSPGSQGSHRPVGL